MPCFPVWSKNSSRLPVSKKLKFFIGEEFTEGTSFLSFWWRWMQRARTRETILVGGIRCTAQHAVPPRRQSKKELRDRWGRNTEMDQCYETGLRWTLSPRKTSYHLLHFINSWSILPLQALLFLRPGPRHKWYFSRNVSSGPPTFPPAFSQELFPL